MTLWQKIVTGSKFLFGGFIPATDYLLDVVLNPYLAWDSIANKVQTAYDACNMILGYLRKYADWCPAKWRTEYDAVVAAVDKLVSVFADGKVERDEILEVIASVQAAKAAWNAD